MLHLTRLRSAIFLAAATLLSGTAARAQALTMDGQSGVFFQPWANVVPAAPGKWNHPTLS